MSSRMFRLTFLFSGSLAFLSNEVVPNCEDRTKPCHVHLELAFSLTMMHYEQRERGGASPVSLRPDGKLRLIRHTDCGVGRTITDQELSRIVTANGRSKLSVLFNGTLPGPAIVVYENQEVVITLMNALEDEATSLHIHGLHQRNTPWMDGAGGGVSHCPINPGESFTYRFIADPRGTHWYHAHHGNQRSMGAYGPFIVIKNPSPTPEFHLMVSDWMDSPSDKILELVRREAVSYSYGFEHVPCYTSTKQADGLDCGVTPFVSAVINGKGLHYRTGADDFPDWPIEVFNIKTQSDYRFRVTCASMTYAFRISIDGHHLRVVATDGGEVEPKAVESVVVFGGERYDIELTADHQWGNFWIRAETLEEYQDEEKIQPHATYAILRYAGSEEVVPTSTRQNCSGERPCTVLNCPYRYHSGAPHTICEPVGNLRLSSPRDPSVVGKSSKVREHFLNFHYLLDGDTWKTNVNGKGFHSPAAPLQVFPALDVQEWKSCAECDHEHLYCGCTQMLEVELGSVVQFVMATTVANPAGVLNGNAHAIHLHGHQFQVLRTGWPVYNSSTGFYQSGSPDIIYDPRKDHLSWSNKSWSGGALGVMEEAAPLKDTVVIPVGGYLVVMFKANNPEFHNIEGMAMIIKVGNDSQMNRVPHAMRQTCGNQDPSGRTSSLQAAASTESDGGVCRAWSNLGSLQLATTALGAVTMCLLFVNLFIICQSSVHKGYSSIPASE